jgi:hypothetical protein
MARCAMCSREGGLHTPGCPVVEALSKGPILGPGGQAINGVMGSPPPLIKSNWECPVCEYNPPSIAIPEAEGKPVQGTVVELNIDNQPSIHCPMCWSRFVAAHAPTLVERKEPCANDSET